jgi:sugar O-acyltransferase (sialic acid O-acetyltransferase NeuD family)
MKKLIIYGSGLIAEVAAFYFRTDTDYRIEAFANAAEFITDTTFDGKPVVPFEELEASFSPSDHEIFIALGYKNTNQVRQSRYLEARARGYTCATYLSSRATYFGTPVGDNCFILENNVIQPFVRIGNNVTLWSGNHIGHHSVIRDHCFISSHVVVSGACDIGENCFLGVNATLRDNLTLGRFVVVASGAVVMKNCEERTLVRPPLSDYKIVEKDLL